MRRASELAWVPANGCWIDDAPTSEDRRMAGSSLCIMAAEFMDVDLLQWVVL